MYLDTTFATKTNTYRDFPSKAEDAFKPKDIFPCTVDGNRWDPALGMSYLFGSFCSDDIFRHDAEMMKAYEAKLEQESAKRDRESQQETQTTETDLPSPVPAKRSKIEDETTVKPAELEESAKLLTPVKQRVQGRPVLPSANNVEVPTSSPVQSPSATTTSKEEEASRETERRRAANRKMAYDAALGIRLTWADYGGLVSTRRKQDVEEFEQEL
ncbi:hypothetical protein P280DRAFT_509154 [Massarina eburnea CBS 473.64]|uniref:Uncharacterized protein n=1 Tax=Massarina eburnea CBS 473.64 TaxID=1395130 RepID=A0A6A6RSU8_9PLEO|nr:hypothetical protein P280DRAFT_509154 [Massarina eburnea CBS 473.64]